MYIVIEYLLIENLIINYIILYVTKTLTRTKTTRLRLILAAILGSLYSLVLFFPRLLFMTRFSIKLLLSVLLVLIAFNPSRFKLFIKQISTFYFVSFIFAGAIIGIYNFTKNSNDLIFKPINSLKGFPIKYLILGIIIAIILIKSTLEYYFTKINKENYLTRVTVVLNNKKVYFTALIDTGNSLKEPFTKKPVMIAEYDSLDHILPVDIREIYINKKDRDLNYIGRIMDELKDNMNLRLIPFKSVGSSNGLIIGFKPDYIVISSNDGKEEINDNIIVGIYNDKLSMDHQYNGLLHPEILGQGESI